MYDVRAPPGGEILTRTRQHSICVEAHGDFHPALVSGAYALFQCFQKEKGSTPGKVYCPQCFSSLEEERLVL